VIITHATHLGTCKSIVTHPASTTHSAMGETEMRKAGISPSMIRFSIGIEDETDLINDLSQAFDAIDKDVKVKEDMAGNTYPQAY
jgi:O-acetylhomoserine/O-acetylserine sulfhydrylase-like pyridoxal-dependent enzyme